MERIPLETVSQTIRPTRQNDTGGGFKFPVQRVTDGAPAHRLPAAWKMPNFDRPLADAASNDAESVYGYAVQA